MRKRSILSICLIITMLICGTHIVEEEHGYCYCMKDRSVEWRRSCAHIELNACKDGKLALSDAEMIKNIKLVRSLAPEFAGEHYYSQKILANAFLVKRISVTNSYSHKILLDYIHLQDGKPDLV